MDLSADKSMMVHVQQRLCNGGITAPIYIADVTVCSCIPTCRHSPRVLYTTLVIEQKTTKKTSPRHGCIKECSINNNNNNTSDIWVKLRNIKYRLLVVCLM